ncbi:hypothetical protein [Bacillus sp. JJ722]|uniref:hypothetical protein n=1 Tax=Bacillus sp. JJ722 TaxID=3122973 RepID=UPI002FFD6740
MQLALITTYYLTNEMRVKKEKMLIKITKKVGEILSCNLKLNRNDSFDGTVTGTKGTVNIRTIVAGGYNIQRVHYRTIIN